MTALRGILKLVIFIFVLVFTKAHASESERVESLRDQALESSLAFDLLESLTTEVGARMPGSPQDKLAVQWAQKKFAALGFDKVWTEPVKFNPWVRGEESARIISPFEQNLHITALGLSVATPIQGLKAQIVHYETVEKLVAAPAGSAAGKIVFISRKMQRHRDGKGYGPVVKARSIGAVEAAKKGAIALVIRSVGTDTHRLPHTGMLRYEDKVKKIPAGAISSPDADLLVRMLKRGKPVILKLKLLSQRLSEYTSHNVIAEMTGTSLPQEKIVIGGHLDSWDLGTGAVDDGAGVAITMAAAKLIGDSEQRPRRTIRVVLWANEEQGLIGAKAYARVHQGDLANHVVGAESDFGAGKIYGFASKVDPINQKRVEQMARLLKPLGVDYVGNNARPGPDLIPMARLGMPVFSLKQDGSDYFDVHHTADDTLDKVKPENLAQNVAAYVVFAYLAANSEYKFQFTPELNK